MNHTSIHSFYFPHWFQKKKSFKFCQYNWAVPVIIPVWHFGVSVHILDDTTSCMKYIQPSVQCAVLHKQYTFTSVCVDFALLSLGFVLKCICPFRKEDTSSALNLPSQNWKFSGLRYSIMQKQRLLQTSHSVTVRLEQRTRRRGIQTNLLLMKHKHMETWSTG